MKFCSSSVVYSCVFVVERRQVMVFLSPPVVWTAEVRTLAGQNQCGGGAAAA